MDLLHLAINLSRRDVISLFPREQDLAIAGVDTVIGQERTSACVAAAGKWAFTAWQGLSEALMKRISTLDSFSTLAALVGKNSRSLIW